MPVAVHPAIEIAVLRSCILRVLALSRKPANLEVIMPAVCGPPTTGVKMFRSSFRFEFESYCLRWHTFVVPSPGGWRGFWRLLAYFVVSSTSAFILSACLRARPRPFLR